MTSLILSVLCVSVLGLCECCSCIEKTKLELGCESDFIFQTEVKSTHRNNADPYDLYYKIDRPSYENTYKFNFKQYVSAANTDRVYTRESSSLCGVFLEEEKTYILSGRVNKEKQRMEISICSSWVEAPISAESQQLLMQFKHETALYRDSSGIHLGVAVALPWSVWAPVELRCRPNFSGAVPVVPGAAPVVADVEQATSLIRSEVQALQQRNKIADKHGWDTVREHPDNDDDDVKLRSAIARANRNRRFRPYDQDSGRLRQEVIKKVFSNNSNFLSSSGRASLAASQDTWLETAHTSNEASSHNSQQKII
ncbi:hypothetical protein DPMN_116660 [Dreissena polymorpha]|uniref:NTR domain-containing protein n=1 Tax=Dreissena polymorpha TaxID=45954 RepID=A0A9D4QUH2_DREPO|nr:hypothetical protein DPMN_116660 [Dreissena polymorpha]